MAAPALVNNSDLDYTAFLPVSTPYFGGTGENTGERAYEFTASDYWILIYQVRFVKIKKSSDATEWSSGL